MTSDALDGSGDSPAEAARVKLGLAEALVSAGRGDEAVAALDDLVETYGVLDDPTVDAVITRALSDKAGLLLLSGERAPEALVVLEALLDRLADATGAGRELRGRTLVNLAQGLALAERFGEALEVFQQFVAEFDEDDDAETRNRLALALGNISGILSEVMERPEEAAAVRARVLREFPEEALASMDAAAAQGAESLEPQRRMQRAGALYQKASLLRDLGRTGEAVALIDAIELEYDGDQHPAIGQILQTALDMRAEIVDGEEPGA